MQGSAMTAGTYKTDQAPSCIVPTTRPLSGDARHAKYPIQDHPVFNQTRSNGQPESWIAAGNGLTEALA
jgi:hypothetical protein